MNQQRQAVKNGSEFKVPNLERGLQVLEYLVGHDSEITVSELSRQLDIPGNSLGRIMNALAHYGYLHRDPASKRYRLTRKLWSMGHGSAEARSLMEDSLDIMRELRDEVGETVVVSIIDQGEGLVLEQVPGLHSFRFVVDSGTRQAIHSSASTKAILAFLPKDKLERVLKGATYTKFTSSTITSRKCFLEELEDVRSKGYALDRAEAIDGVHCVAAPIRNHQGEAEAAITVTGPSNRMSLNSLEKIGVLVKDFTDRVSKRRGFLP